jgi:hypothetical protein
MNKPFPGSQRPLGRLAVVGFLVGILLTLTPAHGELLFSDSFEYPMGILDGQGPPAGSPPGQGGWIASNNNPRVVPFGLDFTGIFSSGNSAWLHSIDDTVSDEAIAAVGPVTPDYGVVWVGFLMRRPQGEDRRGFAVVAVIGESVTDPSVGIGLLFDRKRYGLDNNTGLRGSGVVTDVLVDETITWLVTKLDFTNGQEYLWINPSPDTEPDIANADGTLEMTDAFRAVGFPNVRLRVGYTHSVFQFDELRVGTEFDDIVNPEFTR